MSSNNVKSKWDIPKELQSLAKMASKYDIEQIRAGMDVEQEHNGGKLLDVSNSKLDTLKIVLAHLNEDPKYYTHLKSMENKHSVKEGTTSRDSFRYDKSKTDMYKAPKMKPDHFAQEDMDADVDIDIDYPDKQFANDKPRTRTESAEKNKKEMLKGRRLLWDEDEEDMEEVDIKECIHKNMKVNYVGERYNVIDMTEENIVLQNIRGICVILEIEDIRGITEDNTIVTETDEQRLEETLNRMIKAMKGI